MYPGLPTPDNCVTCRGQKTFRWRDEAGEVAEYQCACKDQWAIFITLLHCGIEKAYQQLRWADVQAEPEAVAKVQHYMAHASSYVNAGCGLIFHGEMGTGKTMLSTLLLKNLVGKGYDGYFTNFGEMVSRFTEGYHDIEHRAWFRRRIENAKVLVIDEIGRETMQKRQEGGELKSFATSVVGSTFDMVLRHRVAAALPTVITTNRDLRELTESYGTNIFSLLSERSSTHRFVGADFRPIHRERFLDEIDLGLTRPVTIG